MSVEGTYSYLRGKKVLLTGGAGYIGSHVCVELQNAGAEVVVIDNLCNSSLESLRRVEEITGKKCAFHNVDLCDMKSLQACFDEHKSAPFEACVHFAGLKAVGESVMQPLMYYENNLQSTTNLLRCLEDMKCTRLVFSSSATVYGDPEELPITESVRHLYVYIRMRCAYMGVVAYSVNNVLCFCQCHSRVLQAKTWATNPYGRTKLFIEEILRGKDTMMTSVYVLLHVFNCHCLSCVGFFM
jgi:UDP-glucose 4-epimerase